LKEDGRKKRIEEIGKEEAWFKRAGQQVEVLFLLFSSFKEVLLDCFVS
jgi:hypothetical protein